MEGETCCNLLIFWSKFNEVQDLSLKVRSSEIYNYYKPITLKLFILIGKMA